MMSQDKVSLSARLPLRLYMDRDQTNVGQRDPGLPGRLVEPDGFHYELPVHCDHFP